VLNFDPDSRLTPAAALRLLPGGSNPHTPDHLNLLLGLMRLCLVKKASERPQAREILQWIGAQVQEGVEGGGEERERFSSDSGRRCAGSERGAERCQPRVWVDVRSLLPINIKLRQIFGFVTASMLVHPQPPLPFFPPFPPRG
jgi:hypothetical protein